VVHGPERIAAAGLVATVSHPDSCIDPGRVLDQSPAGGTAVLPGTQVSLTVTTCPSGGIEK
jgi:beta-lactam-binding protein with PASTA domain